MLDAELKVELETKPNGTNSSPAPADIVMHVALVLPPSSVF